MPGQIFGALPSRDGHGAVIITPLDLKSAVFRELLHTSALAKRDQRIEPADSKRPMLRPVARMRLPLRWWGRWHSRRTAFQPENATQPARLRDQAQGRSVLPTCPVSGPAAARFFVTRPLPCAARSPASG